MRTLEILLGLMNLFTLLFFSIPRTRSKRYFHLLPVLSVGILLLQLIIEKYRWQMVPLYVLTVIQLGIGLRMFFRRKDALETTLCLRILFTGLWIVHVLGVVLPVLVPVPRLSIPTGPYAVGTQTFYWVDENREEIYAEANKPLKRRLMVQVWYPAEGKLDLKPVDYIEAFSGFMQGVGKRYGAPAWIAGHLRLIETHAYSGAGAVSSIAAFPVVVFSHGWTGFRTQNTYQMEDLASHGYVVFSVDHTYGAMATVFPDGEVAVYNPDAIPPHDSPVYQEGIDVLGDTWAADLTFVLDQLALLNQGQIQSVLSGKLDLSRTGMLGHSTGGGAVVEVCQADTRCQAGLAMDAWLEPYAKRMPQQGLRQPFMFLESELWNEDTDDANPFLFNSLFEDTTSDAYLLKIPGAQHTDFAELPSLTPLFFVLRGQPPWYGRQVLEMVNVYTLAFFDRYLRDAPAEVLDKALEAYPKVDVQRP